MTTLLLYLPFVLSWLCGYLLLKKIWGQESRPSRILTIALSGGLGLGISSSLTFASFLMLNSFRPGFVFATHILLIFTLGLEFVSQKKKTNLTPVPMQQFFSILAFAIAMIPMVLEANFYPFGGWDAWSVWNYKAKFLFLAGNDWRGIFEPSLWQSSPHYPLFLPLVNVWGWVFSPTPAPLTPLLTALLFTFLTLLLLYAALEDLTESKWGILAPLLLMTLPFYATLATSQYCDIVISFYLLAALFSLIKTISQSNRGYSILAGLFLGFLSFTKPEGAVAATMTAMIYSVFWFGLARKRTPQKTHAFLWFLAALFVASLATILFQTFLSPGNQTYINGFLSPENPVTWYRAKIVPVFLLVEFISKKWNGLWILVLVGIVVGGKKIWRKEVLIVPLVLFAYLGVVLFYYLLNTYFKIEWWLQVTLNRILFSLLPVAVFWVFYGFKKDPQSPCPPGTQEK